MNAFKFGEKEVVGGLAFGESNGFKHNNAIKVFILEYFPGSIVDETFIVVAHYRALTDFDRNNNRKSRIKLLEFDVARTTRVVEGSEVGGGELLGPGTKNQELSAGRELARFGDHSRDCNKLTEK